MNVDPWHIILAVFCTPFVVSSLVAWVSIRRGSRIPEQRPMPPTRELTDAELEVAMTALYVAEQEACTRRTLEHIAHVEARVSLADDRISAVVEQWKRA